jgi:hypothetical protein
MDDMGLLDVILDPSCPYYLTLQMHVHEENGDFGVFYTPWKSVVPIWSMLLEGGYFEALRLRTPLIG